MQTLQASSRGPGPQAFGKEGEMGSPGLPREARLSTAGAPEPDLRAGGDGGLPAAPGVWCRPRPKKRRCCRATLPQWSAWRAELTRAGSWASGLFWDGTDGAVPAGIRGGRRSRYKGELRSRHGVANPRSSSPHPQSTQTSFPSTKSRPPPFTGAPRAGDRCAGGPAPGCDLCSIQP